MLDLLCALLLLAGILLIVFAPQLIDLAFNLLTRYHVRRARRFVDIPIDDLCPEPVTADKFFPCMGCSRKPQPDFVPYCSCGRGLARIVDSVPTPDDEPTWPDGGKAA